MATIDRKLTPRRGLPLRRVLPGTLAAALSALSAQCAAADWKVAPSIGVRALYTDNIDLAPDAAARSDWVTELVPGIALDVHSTRFKAKAQYALHYFDYRRGTSASRTVHEAHATANAEVLKDLFYIDGAATSTLQNISSFAPVSIDSANAPGNRTEVRTFSISPYLRKNFNNTVMAELRHTLQESKTVDVDLVDVRTNRSFLGIDSGTARSKWGWGVKLDRQKLDYSNRPDVELGRYTGSLRYAVSPRFSLKGRAGREINDYASVNDDTSGSLWSAGFLWAPNEASSLDLEAGHRFFGKTASMAAQHRTPRTVWNLGYAEDVTTESSYSALGSMATADFLDRLWMTAIPDAAARQQAVAGFIRNASLPTVLWSTPFGVSTRVFLQRTLQASVALDGTRNTVLLRLFRSRREPLSAPDPLAPLAGTALAQLDENSLHTGAAALWSWHISPRSDFNVGANYARVRSYIDSRVDHNAAVRLGLTRKIMQRLSATMEVRRQWRNSTNPGAEFTENALSFQVLMQF